LYIEKTGLLRVVKSPFVRTIPYKPRRIFCLFSPTSFSWCSPKMTWP